MTTQTMITIPAPRTAEVVEEVETVPCCFDAEPVTLDDLREHADNCGPCFAYHVQEN